MKFFHCIAASSEKFFAKFAALPFGTFVVTRQVGQTRGLARPTALTRVSMFVIQPWLHIHAHIPDATTRPGRARYHPYRSLLRGTRLVAGRPRLLRAGGAAGGGGARREGGGGARSPGAARHCVRALRRRRGTEDLLQPYQLLLAACVLGGRRRGTEDCQ